MASTADPQFAGSPRVRLLQQLTQRLEQAGELAALVRRSLPGGDPAEIDQATARLETVLQEFKLLAEELARWREETAGDEETPASEQQALEDAAARLARSSAVSGGLLERMVAVSRGLLDLLALAKDGTYGRTGRVTEIDPRGVRLRERA